MLVLQHVELHKQQSVKTYVFVDNLTPQHNATHQNTSLHICPTADEPVQMWPRPKNTQTKNKLFFTRLLLPQIDFTLETVRFGVCLTFKHAKKQYKPMVFQHFEFHKRQKSMKTNVYVDNLTAQNNATQQNKTLHMYPTADEPVQIWPRLKNVKKHRVYMLLKNDFALENVRSGVLLTVKNTIEQHNVKTVRVPISFSFEVSCTMTGGRVSIARSDFLFSYVYIYIYILVYIYVYI